MKQFDAFLSFPNGIFGPETEDAEVRKLGYRQAVKAKLEFQKRGFTVRALPEWADEVFTHINVSTSTDRKLGALCEEVCRLAHALGGGADNFSLVDEEVLRVTDARGNTFDLSLALADAEPTETDRLVDAELGDWK
jgi:hypothetical protein